MDHSGGLALHDSLLGAVAFVRVLVVIVVVGETARHLWPGQRVRALQHLGGRGGGAQVSGRVTDRTVMLHGHSKIGA